MAETDFEQDLRHMFDQPAARLEPDAAAFSAGVERRLDRSRWLRAALLDSVRSHLVADVHVGDIVLIDVDEHPHTRHVRQREALRGPRLQELTRRTEPSPMPTQ